MQHTVLIVQLAGYERIPHFIVPHEFSDVEHLSQEHETLGALEENLGQVTLIINAPNPQILNRCRALHPQAAVILVTDLPMKDYSKNLDGNENDLVQHVIANQQAADWVALQIEATLHKLHCSDIFGNSRYLIGNVATRTDEIRSTSDRDRVYSNISDHLGHLHLRPSVIRTVAAVAEELAMNILFDAPNAAGVERFKSLQSTDAITLLPNEVGSISYATDGRVVALSASDPFGALQRTVFNTYMKKQLNYNNGEDILDGKMIGGGLGLHKIHFSSHAIICNVQPGVRTEIITFFHLHYAAIGINEMPRSIGYFKTI